MVLKAPQADRAPQALVLQAVMATKGPQGTRASQVSLDKLDNLDLEARFCPVALTTLAYLA